MAYTKTTWVNNQAPAINADNLNKIEDGIYNSVRYADAQTLTDAQRTQARGNIGAAPAGYGLGAQRGKLLTSNDDLNNILENGWYYWEGSIPQNAPDVIHNSDGTVIPIMYVAMRVDSMGETSLMQTVIFNDPNCIAEIKRTRAQGSIDYGFGEWGLENPPVLPGFEYRTTERYLGKPVYAKTIECGTVPLNTQKIVSMGVSGRLYKIRCNAWANSDADAFTIPRKLSGTEVTATAASSANNIYISSNTDTLANYTIYATVYYTKDTD